MAYLANMHLLMMHKVSGISSVHTSRSAVIVGMGNEMQSFKSLERSIRRAHPVWRLQL